MKILSKVAIDEKMGTYSSITMQPKKGEPITIKIGDLVQGRDCVSWDSCGVRSETSNIFTVTEINTSLNGNINFRGKEGGRGFHEGKDNIVLLESKQGAE
jgi:hypothetical protein